MSVTDITFRPASGCECIGSRSGRVIVRGNVTTSGGGTIRTVAHAVVAGRIIQLVPSGPEPPVPETNVNFRFVFDLQNLERHCWIFVAVTATHSVDGPPVTKIARYKLRKTKDYESDTLFGIREERAVTEGEEAEEGRPGYSDSMDIDCPEDGATVLKDGAHKFYVHGFVEPISTVVSGSLTLASPLTVVPGARISPPMDGYDWTLEFDVSLHLTTMIGPWLALACQSAHAQPITQTISIKVQ